MAGISPLTALKGVGPKRAAILANEGISSPDELFDYLPRRYLDRRTIRPIRDLRAGENTTIVGTVQQARIEGSGPGRMRFKAVLDDGTGQIELTWFKGVRYFASSVMPGDALAVHGKVGFFSRQAQMQHPDFEHLSGDAGKGSSDYDLFHTGRIIPLYTTSAAMKQGGLGSRQLRTIIAGAFRQVPPGSEENLPENILREHGLMTLATAYREVHFPSSPERLDAARNRMKWTELFYTQLYFALRHARLERNRSAPKLTHSGSITGRFYEGLPFDLTDAQKRVIREIYRDLRQDKPMNRLLQGDVGSGKTMAALFSMALAADNGLQSAFMAPTEILAVQHYLCLKRSLQPFGINVALLAGRQPKRERSRVLAGLADGSVTVAVGTHAMIEHAVTFSRLGLVIIDEQHRFGVMQRKALQEKSGSPHVLLMTATPIPRTLTIAAFGDLDVSIIDAMPKGRVPVQTHLVEEPLKNRAYEAIRYEVQSGRQAYIVYPLVEGSEKIDLRSAVEGYEELSSGVFGGLRLGLIHGQLAPDEKDAVMERFRAGNIDILIGTTVIEVGVDVPNATVMMIEHAERFGLAQLHQLRGRVGRGSHRSSCFLVHTTLAGEAGERLRAMASTTDGFRISEIDAEIRGAGNILGREQAGMVSGLKLADPVLDIRLMESARRAAFALAGDDPELRKPEHTMVRSWYMQHYHERFTLADIG
ncbi:MAG: ATP-dependent DNA helicase RecG [Chlorobium sp.]|uniref:ATP-dependent DNA helicase RecG n=1 Tax=Chlorobium sp. TaxID=1095 RepID=UPI0025C5F8C4|nr:ATP-dependent DNA helicase RecG [Chlorobium sp.]MCF8216816.1 ATP-dependent DNA helicase RecG [Chlorobium sp.]MCF8271661.1 ATP-dependent DNA helicase RecG [Chlorobium sp.]MCF8288033.1 ATP-dependent DNA helicase RecG [Chlorobium sp.]MCF8291617.1 ATP-dependent DNA helicase RecG [Chlorobium sp.]MCF8385749.1 ATP-dependent DNA helicase RecG [Chlorobium sp.]